MRCGSGTRVWKKDLGAGMDDGTCMLAREEGGGAVYQ